MKGTPSSSASAVVVAEPPAAAVRLLRAACRRPRRSRAHVRLGARPGGRRATGRERDRCVRRPSQQSRFRDIMPGMLAALAVSLALASPFPSTGRRRRRSVRVRYPVSAGRARARPERVVACLPRRDARPLRPRHRARTGDDPAAGDPAVGRRLRLRLPVGDRPQRAAAPEGRPTHGAAERHSAHGAPRRGLGRGRQRVDRLRAGLADRPRRARHGQGPAARGGRRRLGLRHRRALGLGCLPSRQLDRTSGHRLGQRDDRDAGGLRPGSERGGADRIRRGLALGDGRGLDLLRLEPSNGHVEATVEIGAAGIDLAAAGGRVVVAAATGAGARRATRSSMLSSRSTPRRTPPSAGSPRMPASCSPASPSRAAGSGSRTPSAAGSSAALQARAVSSRAPRRSRRSRPRRAAARAR